jgi:hypothetical protein
LNRVGHVEPKGPGGPQIDDELELGGIAHLGTAALRDFDPAYVGSGSQPVTLEMSKRLPVYLQKQTFDGGALDLNEPAAPFRRI